MPQRDFLAAVGERVVVFDGGMGATLEQFDLTPSDYGGLEGKCHEALVLHRPDVIEGVHTSMLDAVGLSHLAPADPAGYVAAAAALVGDPNRLAELRSTLRARVASSSLCDGKARTRQMERLYRAIWRRWAAGNRA